MPLNERQYAEFLTQYAEELDIPPNKYQEAVQRYESVGTWLSCDDYEGSEGKEPIVYPQGSFRLGTVTRPIRNSDEGDYDIDLVCEFQIHKPKTTPDYIKNLAGDRLKSHSTYEGMLEEEGRRCWTLNYAEQDGIGFHLDVLPSVLENDTYGDTSIAITHKDDVGYSWTSSNPNGYANWFEERNRGAYLIVESVQKSSIAARYSSIYTSIDSVPNQLVKTPLQRAIQIMKRHRDLRFDNTDSSKYRPISMIITTLAAHLYNGEPDVYTALKNIIERLNAHAVLLKGQGILDESLSRQKLIQRDRDGIWYIANPANPAENFADRWHENNNARAISFFTWVDQLQEDLVKILNSYDRKGVRATLVTSLGANFTNKHFDSLWPLVNPKPNVATAHVNISQGQKPWRKG